MREFCALMDRYREREELAFLRTGIIASTIANCNRDPQHNPEPYTPQDFMPKSTEEQTAHETTEAEMMAELRSLNSLLGGKNA